MDSNDTPTIITTHINADYDALASTLAAQKLYPDAKVVFPGSHEKNLRNFFVDSVVYFFNLVDIKFVDFKSIRRLVLVDTRQINRIGKLADLLDNPDLEIHIYDHHPPAGNDIKGRKEVIEATGATVTLLTEIIRKEGIAVTPDEATIMCLGIYEDTGSFTFASTTEKDFMAAGYLVSKGANLNTISDLIVREISPEQLSLLNEMFQGASHYMIKGTDVVVTSVTKEHYVPDFAFLVHKMMKMENINAIFAIGRMGSKIYLVGRSRTAEVDAGAVISRFGGGGHIYAASAVVREKTLAQVEHELINVLKREVHAVKRARDLMSSPPIMADAGVSCREAGNLLTRYNINALLVTERENGRDRLLGYITRQVIQKAMYLKLENAPVKEYATTELGFVGPEAFLPEIQEKIMDHKQRVLPVVEKDAIVGVITRTDLLNTLVRQMTKSGASPPDPYREEVSARTRSIVRLMKERLSARLFKILKSLGETGDEMGFGIYVVGGFVRDLFLYRDNEDVDIVVEGDGIAFAKRFAAAAGARTHSHEKFGTAVIIFPDGFKIDVASARLEYYRFPADLPTVEMSSIKLDMFRRDFTINTLAVHLNPGKFGTLIDFFSAQKDIKEKAVRVLHNLSFVEDPTRVFRAVRFEQRFGFTMGKLTSSLIKNVAKMDFFHELSGRRVFTELKLILEEENPERAVRRLDDYDLLGAVHPALKPDKKTLSLLDEVNQVLSWHDLLFLEESYMRWAVYFFALVNACDRETAAEICRKLELAPRHAVMFTKERFEAEDRLLGFKRSRSNKNSLIYRTLSGVRVELLLFLMAETKVKRVKKGISVYFTHLRDLTITLTGKDLKKMGFTPGPIYREILDAVMDARLDGLVKTRNDEFKFVKKYYA